MAILENLFAKGLRTLLKNFPIYNMYASIHTTLFGVALCSVNHPYYCHVTLCIYTTLTPKIKGKGMQIYFILHTQVCDIKNIAHLFSLKHSKQSSNPFMNW